MEKPILTIEVAAYSNHMDIQCHIPAGVSYVQVKDALERLVGELNRIIAEGPEKCPYAQP